MGAAEKGVSKKPDACAFCLIKRGEKGCGIADNVKHQAGPNSHTKWTEAQWNDFMKRTEENIPTCFRPQRARNAKKTFKPAKFYAETEIVQTQYEPRTDK